MVISFARGTAINNRYGIMFQIGKGKLGVVYQVGDIVSKKKRAIKFFDQKEGQEDPQVAMAKETEVMKKLEGIDGVPKIFELITCEGYHGYVTELQHQDLLHLSQFAPNNILPEKTVIACGLHVLNTIEKIHSRNIVHRDIKRGNIMLKTEWDTDSSPFSIIDYGLSIDVEFPRAPDTREDQVWYCHYVTPAMNEHKVATRRDDLVMFLYTLLSLRNIRPFFDAVDPKQMQQAYERKKLFERRPQDFIDSPLFLHISHAILATPIDGIPNYQSIRDAFMTCMPDFDPSSHTFVVTTVSPGVIKLE